PTAGRSRSRMPSPSGAGNAGPPAAGRGGIGARASPVGRPHPGRWPSRGRRMGFFTFLRNKRTQGPAGRPVRPAGARPRLEELESRLAPASVSGNAWPNPQLVTLSFVPDGTVLGQNSAGFITSNLFSTFNAKFGSASAWENVILKAAQTWA